MAQAFVPWMRRLLGRGGHADPGEEAGVASGRQGEAPAEGAIPSADATHRQVVHAATGTFWNPGARSAETLVEGSRSAPSPSVGRKVAALMAAEAAIPRGRGARHGIGTGPHDPAFIELTLVELIRARAYDRAFALLTPACQAAWGGVDAFAMAMAASPATPVGAAVLSVRRLPQWDDGGDNVHVGVAELEVEYALAAAMRIRTVTRTVHLVRIEGRWRSMLYP